MDWQSLEAFIRMDGHGPYVWGAYVPTLLALLVEALLVRQRWRAALNQDPEELA